jgi:hypothetical protein
MNSSLISDEAPTTRPGDGDRDLVDAFIGASRVLVAVAARSLADLGEEVTRSISG